MGLILINSVQLEVQHIVLPGTQAELAPLVFLHEGLGSVAMWRDWPAQLCSAAGRAGWVYSRRGYGQSDAVPDVRGAPRIDKGQRVGRLQPDYMHVEAFDVLPALLKVLKIETPVLVGHSDGGSIALLHASRFPVAACVVMAPHVVVEDISVAAITQAKTAFESGGLRARLAPYHADVDCAFWQWNDVWLSPGFRSFDIREDCRRIGAPVLALQGVDDPYGTMQQIEQIALPQGQIIRHQLAQCGHSPQRDQADETIRLISAFLAGIA